MPNEVVLKAAPLSEASALDHIPEWFDTQWDLGNIRPVEGHVDGSDRAYLVVETPKGLELCQTGETIVLHDDGTLSVNHIPPRPKAGKLIDWNELTKKWPQNSQLPIGAPMRYNVSISTNNGVDVMSESSMTSGLLVYLLKTLGLVTKDELIRSIDILETKGEVEVAGTLNWGMRYTFKAKEISEEGS